MSKVLKLVTVPDKDSPKLVTPKYDADYALFRHCNCGSLFASSQDSLTKVWPEIQLHLGHTGYRIEGTDGG